uniref:F5/8 type C domain-containing protein n=1 Tax=Elaeophora elaphi TaxID=1147741 RepID=A0A0R3S0D8_9BILA
MIRRSPVLIVLVTLISRKFLIHCSLSSMLSNPVAQTSFWITVEPLSVTWTNGCLATAGCDDSRLTLSEWNLVSDERISSSWSIHELFDSSHMFVSYWSKGRPADITFNYEIVGADPIYGFSRTCDSTRAVRVFDDKSKLTSNSTAGQAITTKMHLQQSDKVTLNLTGKCFNAAIIIQKYESNCPWCSCGEKYAIVGQLSEFEPHESLNSSSETLVDIGLMTLSAIAVATSAAFSCVLIAYLRERRLNFDRNVGKYGAECCNNNSAICHGFQTTSAHKKRSTNTEITRYQPALRDYPTLMSRRNENNQRETVTGNKDISDCRISVNDWNTKSALLDGVRRYGKPIDITSVCNDDLKA